MHIVQHPSSRARHQGRAEKHPRPNVASFHFTPRSGKARVSTRMRLLKTQNVVAVAEMSDGSFYMTKTQMKVTIGGCGG